MQRQTSLSLIMLTVPCPSLPEWPRSDERDIGRLAMFWNSVPREAERWFFPVTQERCVAAANICISLSEGPRNRHLGLISGA